MSLDEVDKIVHDFIIADDAYPSAIDFMHFPKSVCLSVNDVVSHGVPNTYVLEDGDALNIDIVCYKNGHHGDNSAMLMLGNVDPEVQRLSKVTREAMYYAIEMCAPGVPFSRIGEVIQDYTEDHGYVVNEEFGGHGIGAHLHMAPMIYHHKTPSYTKEVMKPGMAFTIEPICMMKSARSVGYI